MVLRETVKLILPIAEAQYNLFVLYPFSLCGDEIKADIWLQFCWNWASDILLNSWRENIYIEREREGKATGATSQKLWCLEGILLFVLTAAACDAVLS